MKPYALYQVDAFTDRLFAGNPAAVVPLDVWLPDEVLRQIAAENNLSETAFFVAKGDRFHLRWFTPVVEMDLCGHATLAAASVIIETLQPARSRVEFESRSGVLRVSVDQDVRGRLYTLDFPADPPEQQPVPPALAQALGVPVREFWVGKRALAVLDDEAAVRAARPLAGAGEGGVGRRNLIVSAAADPSGAYDIVSRFFAPMSGIIEDPVTGSAHCTLAPYWAARLGRSALSAYQASARGGAMTVRLDGERVYLSGRAVRYLDGQIYLNHESAG